MPFYELICISRAQLKNHSMTTLLKTSAETVLDRGGVVREFVNLGRNQPLPYRMKSHMEYHTHGSFWIMRFYSNPLSTNVLKTKLKLDPRVVRCNIVKLTDKLEEMIGIPEKTS